MERFIDLVIPMVFPHDPEWQREYARVLGCSAGTAANVRFRSWGTEEMLVRCCMKYLPWLRTIHILLAAPSQVQPWMETLAGEPRGTLPKVKIVFHREFVPPEVLPCFSSPCIEMFLHRIPELSEQFIYANDDMFPLSPLEPEDFFRSDGRDGAVPCQHFSERAYPANPNIFQRKCMWQQNLVGSTFGRRYTRVWLKNGHGFAPILKSSCEEVWRLYGDEIRRNLSPLKRTDRSANHYIYQLYQLFSGRYVDHEPRGRYVGDGVATGSLAAIIRDPQAGIVCINDNEREGDWQRRAAIVRREIGTRLKN